MGPLIVRTEPRWRWAAAWVAALAMLLGLTLLPRPWWEAIWPRGRLRPVAAAEAPVAFSVVEVAEVRPPRTVLTRPDSTVPIAAGPVADSAWWVRAWQARVAADFSPPVPALPDSLIPTPLRDLWGARAAVDLILATPDSVVRARLWLLVEAEDLAASDVAGLFAAIARARAHADRRSREADIFDEFLPSTVPVTR